jgi:hypothetical protein
MTDPVAEKMSEASPTRKTDPPRKGDRFRCPRCGMEIQVTADCRCSPGEHVRFRCCGEDLNKV